MDNLTPSDRIKCLKSIARNDRGAALKDGFERSTLMPTALYEATNKSVEDFLTDLEKLCKSVHVSDIVEQVTLGGNTILHLAAKNGKRDILGLMADEFPLLIRKRNMTRDTVLHFAARIKVPNLIPRILKINNDHFGDQDTKELLRMDNQFGDTALHEAVKASNDMAVKDLFEADKEVANYLNKEGKSPLYLAVETKEDRIIYLLLEAALFENRKKHQGTSPLHAAIMVMNSGGETSLMPQPLLPRQSLPRQWLPLPSLPLPSFTANTFPGLQRSRAPDVPTPVPGPLIFKKKNPDVERPPPRTDKETNTNWCEKIIKKSQKYIFLKDQNGRTALHFAASTGNLEGVSTILKASIESALEWDLKGYLPIHIACKKGHVHLVKQFLLQDKDPRFDPLELLNQKGQNLLHIAAKNGNETVVEYILNEDRLKKLLNERDKNGNTSLHLASKYMHPKILHLLTQDNRLNVNLVNNEGMTARDTIVDKRSTPPTLREFLSFTILKSSGTPLSEKGRRIRHSRAEPPQIEWIKDRVNFMLLVAILIATVTFAAGFTVPGGINSSEDKSREKIGMATSLNRKMFQLFTICDATAMYSSTLGSSILLWAHLGDFHLASSATYLASYLVGFALLTMSVAFMAGLHLVVRNVSWLAGTVIAIALIFLLLFLGVYIILIFPLGERGLFFGPITDFLFKMFIPLSGSHGKLKKVKYEKKEESQGTEKEEKKCECQPTRMEMEALEKGKTEVNPNE